MKAGTPEYNERQRDYYKKRSLSSGLPTIKCLICGKDFRQVGSHIAQIHGMTAREYRIEFGLDVKRGLLPEDLRLLKARKTLENGTIENLKQGAKFRFKKGDERAGRYERSLQTMERLKVKLRNTKKQI